MAAPAGVCLCLQAALDAGVVNEPRLAAAAAQLGLRVRPASSAAADLLVCKAGSTLAFLQWRGGGGGGADSSVDGGNAARIARMSAAFKSSFVLVPYAQLGDAEVLNAAARATCDEAALAFVQLPMGADFAEAVLGLAAELLTAEAEQPLWRQQQAETVESVDAVTAALAGLPLPADGEALHHTRMLRMLGSIADISERRADEIAAHTSLDPSAAAAVVAFFQRGGRQAEPLAGLPGLGGGVLPSL